MDASSAYLSQLALPGTHVSFQPRAHKPSLGPVLRAKIDETPQPLFQADFLSGEFSGWTRNQFFTMANVALNLNTVECFR